MYNLMILPASLLTSVSVGVAPTGFGIQFHPLTALSPPPPSGFVFSFPPKFAARKKLRCSGRKIAPTANLLILPRPSPFDTSSFRSGRGALTRARRRTKVVDFRARAAKVSASPAAEDNKDGPEDPRKSQIMESISELQEKLMERFRMLEEEGSSSDGESDEDDKERKKEMSVSATSEAKAEQEPGLEAVVHEYKLTEDGAMNTLTVTVGGSSQPTRNHLERMLAHVGIQAEVLQEMMHKFSVRKFFRDWGKKEPGLEDLRFNPSMYSPKSGISNITQWTALELTLQRASMTRIARDTLYLISAFTLFGVVRILEAVATVFSTNPPNYMKIFDGLNALDPLTIASLAHGLRKPVLGMLDVDPTDLEEVSSLKAKFWAELHKFYERQWKVMATLGFARLLALIVSHLPSAEWVTSKVKVMWDISMALPIF